ncbi:MAG: SDR family NAD(P)-dependent oxidoreductase, partial [Actinobacteria bacterium]|nr:SDR family NAD(P)-dependent oxidoreductase [Actinomycetota bacterium]
DLAAAGLGAADHPLLGAAVALADKGEWLFTGRVSLASHPWLGDHAVFDTVLLPGTAFVELALRAGSEVGCDTVEELTLHEPLAFMSDGAVQLQVTVADADDDARRNVAIYSRPCGEDTAVSWTRHADGLLAAATGDDALADDMARQAWPPEGAESLDVDELYDRLVAVGFGYGPAFQGVGQAWRRGDELFAELALDREQAGDAAGFAIHPALLDSAFHAVIDALAQDLEQDRLPLPFSWSGVRLHRGGAAALRIRVAPGAGGALQIAALDETGTPVLSVASLLTRALDAARLAGTGGASADPLLALRWPQVALAATNGHLPNLVALGDLDAGNDRHADVAALGAAINAGAPMPDAVLVAAPDSREARDPAAAARVAVRRTLALLQDVVSDVRLAGVRLVVLTRGAVAVGERESPDVAAAAVCGLVRSAQSEHPGRFVLVDVDAGADVRDVPWAALLAGDEPQVAWRDGQAFVARLAPADRPSVPAPAFDPQATVLITGGTGGIGALLARHLAAGHAVKHLLLVSRRGLQAPGAPELAGELAKLGCDAQIVACDVASRADVQALLASIPQTRPLKSVVHAAGVLDDATITSLTAEQVDRVMRPKVDAAQHLHELTDDLDHFVVFSSAAPLLGGPGQGNYAAANAYLDALAQQRHADNQPATSIAWGLWNQDSGMAAEL